jgi:uncharacterized repeat protein (TIGR03803 family)
MLREKTPDEASDRLGTARLSSEVISASAAAAASSSAPHAGPRKPRSLGLPVFAFALISTLLLASARPAQAQTETILYHFNCGFGGCNTYAGVVLDQQGNLYGTTGDGGNYGLGTVYKLSPTGTFTALYSFCSAIMCTDGVGPVGGVVLDAEGNFYGTTAEGGGYKNGVVYKLTPAGTETVLHDFGCQTDGCRPFAAVVLDKEGNVYGTAAGGAHGAGVVFKITPSGKFKTLYSFCSLANCADGANGQPYGVVLDSKGNLYGATSSGGAYNYGAVFKLSRSGTETVLHSFAANGEDGYSPAAGVILDSKDNVYGTTQMGGTTGFGTVFEVTAAGTETILHSFAGGEEGISPEGSLVFDTKGNLYGTTYYGGSFGFGTVFELTPSGVETTLHSFARNPNGYSPFGTGLTIDASGNLYGTTEYGRKNAKCGPINCGVVYKIVP